MGMDNFFQLVMEAEGDLPDMPADMPDMPVDGGDPAAMDDAPTDSSSDDFGLPDMPSSPDDAEIDLGGDMGSDDSDSDSSDDKEEKKEKAEKDKISYKTNNILNERLYDEMIHRNKEIEDVIENLQKISPILPSDVVVENDESLNQLKQALTKGKSYVIDKFINSEYGENMLFFKKLDSLYKLLMDKIDTNLKGIDKSSND